MSVIDDTNKAVKRIEGIFEKRKAAIYAISLNYAAIALTYFKTQQAGDGFWNNQTADAFRKVFTNAFIEGDVIGWFIAHNVEYGIYLELANDRQNEALRPVIKRFAGRYFDSVAKLYK